MINLLLDVHTCKTVFVYSKGKIEFVPEDAVLTRLIPEKEISVVKQKKAIDAATKKASPSIEERLETLESLKSRGLITEEEYHEKREKILDEL